MAPLGGEAPERCRRSWNITAFGVRLLGVWRRSLALGMPRVAPELPLLAQSSTYWAEAVGGPPGAIRGS